MWVENGVSVSLALIIAFYFTSLADRPVEYLPVVGVIALGVLLFVTGVRRRPVCVIEPTRVGYGFVGGRMWWFDREQMRSVLVRQDLLLQVRFYDRDGKITASHVFGCFDPKEPRQAFESAGIPVR
ncbi:MAG: hypothetical protein ACRD0K_11165 [Egibacteraceae bacterium]